MIDDLVRRERSDATDEEDDWFPTMAEVAIGVFVDLVTVPSVETESLS